MLFHLDSVQYVHIKVTLKDQSALNLIYIYFLLKMSLLMLVVQTNLRNSSLLTTERAMYFYLPRKNIILDLFVGRLISWNHNCSWLSWLQQ
jgi:hypothetical protein